MHLKTILEFARNIDGWMDLDEMEWLYNQASRLPPGAHWVEVGCWKGRSFFPTAMGMKAGQTIHAVDTFLGDDKCPNHWEAREVPNWIYNSFCAAVNAVKDTSKSCPLIQVWRMSSIEAAHKLNGLTLDGVFIDASHYEDAFTADLKAWVPLIKPGGMICGHDSSYPDVNRVLTNTFRKWNQGPKTIWWVKK